MTPRPGSVLALTTAAPAPSAKSTQVPRSVQSVILERTSTPTTRMVLQAPVAMYWRAVFRA